MRKVRVAASMATALDEAEVGLFTQVVNAFGGEVADALGQAFGVVGGFDQLGDFVLW